MTPPYAAWLPLAMILAAIGGAIAWRRWRRRQPARERIGDWKPGEQAAFRQARRHYHRTAAEPGEVEQEEWWPFQ